MVGGRSQTFEANGFKFDMGPSWYWMPDVFERFFSDFEKKASDYYVLEKLSPAYSVYFGENDFIKGLELFEAIVESQLMVVTQNQIILN